jgi:hypothetical protein
MHRGKQHVLAIFCVWSFRDYSKKIKRLMSGAETKEGPEHKAKLKKRTGFSKTLGTSFTRER